MFLYFLFLSIMTVKTLINVKKTTNMYTHAEIDDNKYIIEIKGDTYVKIE